MSLHIKSPAGTPDIAIGSVRVKPSTTTKIITANGTYNASSDSVEGYSSVTVNVPGEEFYFGTATARTSANAQHIQFKQFPTTTYGTRKAGPIMCKECNDIFPFTSFSIAANEETASLTYANTAASVYISNSKPRIEVQNIDYFTQDQLYDWTDEYAISSKTAILSFQYGRTDPYVALAFGKTKDNSECMVFNGNYDGNLMTKYNFGTAMSGSMLTENTATDGGYVLLVPFMSNDRSKIMDGIFKVIYGDEMHGFYEINEQLFYISAGIAIKDE